MAEKRIETIDVFRGIAILTVVLFHFTARLPPAALNVTGAAPPPVFFGWAGVYFFFAISGYCIFLTLEKAPSVTVFLAKRFSRLYPAFLAAAVFLFLYGLVSPTLSVPEADFHAEPSTVVDLLTNLVFLGDGRWVNGSFWSIAAEIKFYLLLGLLALAIPDHRRLAKVFTWVSLIAAPLWMLAMVPALRGGTHLPEKLLEIGTIAPYLPFFAIGILARMRKLKAMPTTMLLTLCGIEGAAVIGLNALDASTSLVAAAISVAVAMGMLGLLVAFADDRKIPHVPYLSSGLAQIGVLSFSWYLIHENLGVGFLANLDRIMPAPLAVVVAMAMTLVIAYVFSWLVEWRFRKLFERLALAVLDTIGPMFTPRSKSPVVDTKASELAETRTAELEISILMGSITRFKSKRSQSILGLAAGLRMLATRQAGPSQTTHPPPSPNTTSANADYWHAVLLPVQDCRSQMGGNYADNNRCTCDVVDRGRNRAGVGQGADRRQECVPRKPDVDR